MPLYSAPIDEYLWFMSYRVDERPSAVHFNYGKIITILPLKGFHLTDIRELTTSMLPRVEFTIEEQKAGLGSAKALSVVATPATNGEFSLLCYDKYGVYMDGERTLYEPFTLWDHPAQRIAFQDYFALVLSKNHLEVHQLIKRKRLQLVPGKFRILSGEGAQRVVAMRSDGEIFEFVGDPTA
ncbi:hypothetical protein BDN72DRAFT_583078 [Pluteus cervinus]|uniref:Uncharacterized protein n=1 Tax=Pluteus cervinus TaxID=181527 RepID=A0ACD3AVJ9_9AGAR|nr:hypothetical protein BDN72DRAFT_583078 [Pluteus cervinus]